MRLHLFILAFLTGLGTCIAQPFTLTLKSEQVEVYDFQEITLTSKKSDPRVHPFKDTRVEAVFQHSDGERIQVEGFCDSPDGRVYKVRFMPSRAGAYMVNIRLISPGKTHTTVTSFTAVSSSRRGPLRLDTNHPGHFQYQNGDRFFWNSTTTYWMLGWRDDQVIYSAIDRLAGYGINRIRIAINGRSHGGSRWYEPTVVECPEFTLMLNPWVAERPADLDSPGFDVTRFEVSHWQKLDRLIAYCSQKGIVVSLIFYVDGLDHATDPFKKENMGNEDEQRYYAYAAARYAAFENIMWDIANEYHLFRTPEWAEKMGAFLRSKDPYQHLISVHGNSDFPFRKAPWVDVIMHQSWDECGGYDFITETKALQASTGRVLPVVNEEYGYEGHYAPWGCGATAGKDRPDGRSGLNRSQLAWEICMAGGYQTTGETAEFGTGAGENTGGGWINGRGNGKMTMLTYYQIMRKTFEQTEYWKLVPRNDLVSLGNLCLANEGVEYLIYSRLPHCRIKLSPGQRYSVKMINPQTGEETTLPDADTDLDSGAWQYRRHLTGHWVFVLKRRS